jgi:hypothetical protein
MSHYLKNPEHMVKDKNLLQEHHESLHKDDIKQHDDIKDNLHQKIDLSHIDDQVKEINKNLESTKLDQKDKNEGIENKENIQAQKTVANTDLSKGGKEQQIEENDLPKDQQKDQFKDQEFEEKDQNKGQGFEQKDQADSGLKEQPKNQFGQEEYKFKDQPVEKDHLKDIKEEWDNKQAELKDQLKNKEKQKPQKKEDKEQQGQEGGQQKGLEKQDQEGEQQKALEKQNQEGDQQKGLEKQGQEGEKQKDQEQSKEEQQKREQGQEGEQHEGIWDKAKHFVTDIKDTIVNIPSYVGETIKEIAYIPPHGNEQTQSEESNESSKQNIPKDKDIQDINKDQEDKNISEEIQQHSQEDKNLNKDQLHQQSRSADIKDKGVSGQFPSHAADDQSKSQMVTGNKNSTSTEDNY